MSDKRGDRSCYACEYWVEEKDCGTYVSGWCTLFDSDTNDYNGCNPYEDQQEEEKGAGR